MKIVKAEVFVTCPGRNFVTLKITTEDGITGLGDATLNGRELSVASYLQDTFVRSLLVAMRTVSKISGSFSIKVLTGVAVRLRCRPFQRLIWRCGILKPKLPTCRFTSYSAARLVKG